MKTALIIIDIQNDYFADGKMPLTGSIQASAAATRLLAAFRREHWPVYHVQHHSIQHGANFLVPNTTGATIHNSVKPLSSETVIVKNYPNSFRNTDLEERLRADKISTLLVSGMMTHMCVDATVRAAFDLGFANIIAHDACATRDLLFNGVNVPASHVQASYMAAFSAVYAQVKEVDEILENIAANY